MIHLNIIPTNPSIQTFICSHSFLVTLHAAASEPKFQSIYLIVIRFLKMLNIGSDTWGICTPVNIFIVYFYLYFWYWRRFHLRDFYSSQPTSTNIFTYYLLLVKYDFTKRTFDNAGLSCDPTLALHHLFSPWLSVNWGITQPVSSHRLFPGLSSAIRFTLPVY